jgi:hypothetical protein
MGLLNPRNEPDTDTAEYLNSCSDTFGRLPIQAPISANKIANISKLGREKIVERLLIYMQPKGNRLAAQNLIKR